MVKPGKYQSFDYWDARCDCGRTHVVQARRLNDGTVSRCKHCADVERRHAVAISRNHRIQHPTLPSRRRNAKA